MPELTFTLANHGKEPALLFHSAIGFTPDITNLVNGICSDELFQKIFPQGAYLSRYVTAHGSDCILAEVELRSEFPEKLGESGILYDWNPDTGVTQHDLESIYYACRRPERTLLSCTECADSSTPDNSFRYCYVVQAMRHSRRRDEAQMPTVSDVRALLVNRKSVLAEFTYISPRLTLAETTIDAGYYQKTFDTYLRPPERHDFGVIEENSLDIIKALQTRTKRDRFKKNVCSTCMMQSVCESTVRHWHCDGSYGQDVDAMAAAVLAETGRYWNVWSDAQIRYVLENSGELRTRFSRAIIALTFNRYGEIEIRYARHPGRIVAAYHTWKEFAKDAECYGLTIPKRLRGYNKKLPSHFRGLLAAACSMVRCPHRSGWGNSHQYPVMAVTCQYVWGAPSAPPNGYHICYLWYRDKTTMWSPGRYTVDTFADVFRNLGYIPNMSRTRFR